MNARKLKADTTWYDFIVDCLVQSGRRQSYLIVGRSFCHTKYVKYVIYIRDGEAREPRNEVISSETRDRATPVTTLDIGLYLLLTILDAIYS